MQGSLSTSAAKLLLPLLLCAQPSLASEFSFSDNQFTVSEASGEAIVSVLLSSPATDEVRVRVQTRPGSARPEIDYRIVNQWVTFTPGMTRADIGVPVIDNDRESGNVDFRVRLKNALGAEISTPDATIVILDDELEAITTVVFDQAIIVVDEENGTAEISCSLSAPAPGAEVTVRVVGGSATDAEDYEAIEKRVVLTNDTNFTVTIPILDDEKGELDEGIEVSLTNPDGVLRGEGTLIQIVDNETKGPRPIFAIGERTKASLRNQIVGDGVPAVAIRTKNTPLGQRVAWQQTSNIVGSDGKRFERFQQLAVPRPGSTLWNTEFREGVPLEGGELRLQSLLPVDRQGQSVDTTERNKTILATGALHREVIIEAEPAVNTRVAAFAVAHDVLTNHPEFTFSNPSTWPDHAITESVDNAELYLRSVGRNRFRYTWMLRTYVRQNGSSLCAHRRDDRQRGEAHHQ